MDTTTYKKQGFTLVELLAVVTITGILGAVAVPSFNSMLDKYRLKSVADAFYNDLQNIKSAGAVANKNVYLNVSAASAWCWGATVKNATCDCTVTTPSATNFCEVKNVQSTEFMGVTVSTTFPTGVTFEPTRGTISSTGKATFTSTAGLAADVSVSKMGYPKVCATTSNLAGYPAC